MTIAPVTQLNSCIWKEETQLDGCVLLAPELSPAEMNRRATAGMTFGVGFDGLLVIAA
jgi:hypothetical protein